MARLERSIEVMDGLFSTILDLSKLDSGAVKPEIADGAAARHPRFDRGPLRARKPPPST